MKKFIGNAFSINMLKEASATVEFKQLALEDAAVASVNAISAVGHADIAQVFSSTLGVVIPENRLSVTLDKGDVLIVGQYTGPRLPEGCKILPEGATIVWWQVEVK